MGERGWQSFSRYAVACKIDPNVNFGGPDAYFARETKPEDMVWLKP